VVGSRSSICWGGPNFDDGVLAIVSRYLRISDNSRVIRGGGRVHWHEIRPNWVAFLPDPTSGTKAIARK